MNTAQKIIDASTDWHNAIGLAENNCDLIETNQDWKKETTTFIFEDGSKLFFTFDEYKSI